MNLREQIGNEIMERAETRKGYVKRGIRIQGKNIRVRTRSVSQMRMVDEARSEVPVRVQPSRAVEGRERKVDPEIFADREIQAQEGKETRAEDRAGRGKMDDRGDDRKGVERKRTVAATRGESPTATSASG